MSISYATGLSIAESLESVQSVRPAVLIIRLGLRLPDAIE